MAELLLGKPVADQIYEEICQSDEELRLAVLGFENPQWRQYVSALQKCAERCRVTVEDFNSEGKTPLEFSRIVAEVSSRRDICGVMIQQPLPGEFAASAAQIPPEKDIDCISDLSVARLYRGKSGFCPATPLAVLKLLEFYNIDLYGKNVVIVGRGAVGKPLALLCLQHNATVTVCHTKTKNLSQVCKGADILISACGVAGLITRDFVTANSVVIDVGLSFAEGKTRGDVSEEVFEIAKAVSPVPGGVGPVTRAALFSNLLHAKSLSRN